MRKKKISQSISTILLTAVVSTQLNAQISQKIYIGYIDEYPVFEGYLEHKVYILKDTIEELFEYPKNYSLCVVKNNFQCFTEGTRHDTIVLLAKNEEKKYVCKEGAYFVVLDEEGYVFFMDKNTNIKCIINDEIRDTKLKGYCIDVVDGFLYYSKIPDPKIIYPNVDIFEIDVRKLQNPRKLLANVSGERTIITSNGKYIYEHKIIDVGFKPIIYNVEKRIFKRIFVEKEFSEFPFYSFQENALIFYNTETLKFQKVSLLDEW